MSHVMTGRLVQLRGRLAELAMQARHAYLQVFGIPDYERYLTHMATHHPGEVLLNRREFSARAIDHKYCRAGTKSC